MAIIPLLYIRDYTLSPYRGRSSTAALRLKQYLHPTKMHMRHNLDSNPCSRCSVDRSRVIIYRFPYHSDTTEPEMQSGGGTQPLRAVKPPTININIE